MTSNPTQPDLAVLNVVTRMEAAGLVSEDLDDAVTTSSEERASNVNNAGLYAQVHYLMRAGDNSWKPEEVIHAATAAHTS